MRYCCLSSLTEGNLLERNQKMSSSQNLSPSRFPQNEDQRIMSTTIPLRDDDPTADDGDGLIGSPTDKVTVFEESGHSLALAVDSAKDPSPEIAESLDCARPLHQSVTDSGPSKVPNADLRALLTSDCSKLIANEA
nr:hypothetical protein Iba_chr08aCG2470 [Ipomoea batatas]